MTCYLQLYFNFIINILAISSLIQSKHIISIHSTFQNHLFQNQTFPLSNFDKEDTLPMRVIKVISSMPVSEKTLNNNKIAFFGISLCGNEGSENCRKNT